MNQESTDAIGAQVFGLLVSLLRPVARRRVAGTPFGDSRRVSPPPQRTEIDISRRGREGAAEVQMWISSPGREASAFAWTLPLPEAAGVARLDLECPGGHEPAGLCERREARQWFDLARRTSLPSALLAEDAPGVFGLEAETPGCGALHLRFGYTWRAAQDADLDLQLRCEAAEAVSGESGRRARLLRLGASHRLDPLVGIVAAAAHFDGTRHSAEARGADGAAAEEPRRPDVFASCDRADGAGAIYRGSLAGRAVRLWADLRTPLGAALPAVQPEPTEEIARLMARYRAAECSESVRRDLASEVARLGLMAGVATLWTSFVAVVGARDPGGELVFAAA